MHTKKVDEGYHYLPSADVSLQGQDANAAWRCALLVAKALNEPVEVSFIWRNKDGAEYPGKSGTLKFSPR